MLDILRASALIAGSVFLASQANAAVDYGPADTASFVPYCATNFEACRNEVLSTSNYNQIGLTGSAHPGCTFPHTTPASPEAARATVHADSIAATKAIIEWLKANAAVRAPKTDEAISQAMKALWPNDCQH